MEFAKATIEIVERNAAAIASQLNIPERFEIQFNPTEYSLEKGSTIAEIGIPGLDSPLLQFIRGNNERLNLELFFDVTKRGPEADAANQPSDVRELSGRLEKLARIASETHAPPRIRLTWKQLSFKAVIESVQQRFTLFSADGTPLRAFVTVILRRYQTLKEQLEALNLQSADHSREYVVRQGDTLGSIAYEAYGDAGLWRQIALYPPNARHLDNPRRLRPGLHLQLPRLSAGIKALAP